MSCYGCRVGRPAETVRITVDGEPVPLRKVGSYAYITREQISVGSEIVLHHDLPTQRTVETLPAGDTYEFAWRGDEITGVYPNVQPLPFYPTLNNPQRIEHGRGRSQPAKTPP